MQANLDEQSFFESKMTSKPNEKMTKVEMNAIHQMFARKAEETHQNNRIDKKLIKSRNRITGLLLAAMVGGVCKYFWFLFGFFIDYYVFSFEDAYTILTVKQEKFLDELDDHDQPASQ